MNQTLDLPLDALAPDEGYQPREGLDPDHLERLRCSDIADWPPLLVSPVSDEAPGYFIIDGFHRYQVAKERQLQTIRCTILPDAGYEEAFAANLKHGLPLSMQDRKAYASFLHEHYPEMSTREIARKAGLSQSTVSQITSSLITNKRANNDEARQDHDEQEARHASQASRVRELEMALAQCQASYGQLLALLTQKRAEETA